MKALFICMLLVFLPLLSGCTRSIKTLHLSDKDIEQVPEPLPEPVYNSRLVTNGEYVNDNFATADKQKLDLLVHASNSKQYLFGKLPNSSLGHFFPLGEPYQLQEKVWVVGQKLHGMKILVSGNAFSRGLLAKPQSIVIELFDKNQKVTSFKTAKFSDAGDFTFFVFLDKLELQGPFQFRVTGKSLRAGKETMAIVIAPTDDSAAPLVLESNITLYSSDKLENRLNH